MKRSLITFAALYLLYDRQKRVERRMQEQRAAQLALEAHTTRFAEEVNEQFEGLEDFAKGYRQWADDLVKQVERAFKEGAR